jgi:DNA helicase-2/ATP-dependent DNA helicase PcrA
MHDALLDSLTGPQRQAVAHIDGPLLVLAGAGSGKTRVITRRAAHIAAVAAKADEVLAITFTNKAAGEMRDRIYALGVSGRMWVHTFHSLCARLLRDYASAAGINPNYTIFDESDRRSLLRETIADCGLSVENWPPRAAEHAISTAKNRLLTPARFEAEATDFSNRTLARIYAKYQERLTEQGGCDFDDLLMRVALMLDENEAVRTELSNRFKYLLIDEYQDTNRAQYLIASRLATTHRNICATGDPDQSIYAWRGADIRNILDFEEDYPDAAVIRLEQNFRSTASILSAASKLISENTERKHKDLWTEGKEGPAVRVWSCEDERQEAAKIAEDIRAHLDAGGQGGDVAIFYRVNALSRVVEDELRSAKIPYQIARGVEFYERKEIKDVLAYLRSIVNPADETAILRAINTPARGIGKTTIDRVKAHARQNGLTFDQALCGAASSEAGPAESRPAADAADFGRVGKKIAVFAALLAELRAFPRRPVQPLIDAVLKKSGLEASLAATGAIDNEPLANVYELASAAHQYDTDNPEGSLEEWLQQISLVTDLDAVDLAGGPVTLMTLHTAKGLEFPIVYMVGLEEGLLPHSRAVKGSLREIEEERRLCFVGMTRAQERLTLTSARYRMFRGITERTLPSTFLRELPKHEIERETFSPERERSTAHLGHFNDEGAMSAAAGLYPGLRVRHEEYGEGQVLRIEPRGRATYVRIRFDDYGERAFAADHVSLYIME